MDKPQSKKRLISYESKFLNFDTLMQFRVKHILLVSSSYDSYVLEEDGQLTDLIYNEYLELNLTISPHVKRANNAVEALEILKTQSIDMVLIFKRVSDIDVLAFGRAVKDLIPDMPVILLAYHERELAAMMTKNYSNIIDQIFVWTGDVRILLSIIKLIEDRKNVEADTARVGVRVIIIVEDSVKFFSSYLPLVYREIMLQTRALMAEGLNISHKILRMRARPKILLAQNYEEAWQLFEKYQKYLLAIISDFRFKIGGEIDDEAGIKLIRKIREQQPDLPIIMQSSGMLNAELAQQNRVGFLYKQSPTLHTDLRNFILSHFGFGDFSFIDPDSGEKIAAAGDFKSMEKCLTTVPDKSLVYHASRNHFSNWLMARTEFDLAAQIRPVKVSAFKDAAALRAYLINAIQQFRREKALGVITDFSRRQFDLQTEFVRLGGGSIGGKGRGLAFINALLHQFKLSDSFEGVTISVPKSIILGTDVFDDFMQENDLAEYALKGLPDEEIGERFLKAKLPKNILGDLDTFLDIVKYPLAVRSSSMLEDSHLQTFAGIYETHMLPNNHSSRKTRRQQLEQAIKSVYASTFFKNARAYHEAAGNRVEEEKMAVIIQQAVGRNYGKAFYPSFAGVALSYNYYPIDGVEPEDGVVYVALGLGKTIVEGMNCLRFSPSYPNKLPQLSTVKDMLKNTQHEFFAIDMTNPSVTPRPGGDDGVIKLTLSQAEEDGTIENLCSTYSAENDRIYDGYRQSGTRVITFSPILKSNTFPLTEIVKFLLQLGSEGLNCPVEIEFAVDLDTPEGQPKDFYFLQVRPMIKDAPFETISIDSVKDNNIIARSEKTLGNMRTREIRDIVLVSPETFERGNTVKIAGEVGRFNDRLNNDNIPYLLIGPGRWGTSERWLGIPVVWNQISGARIIIEAAYGDFAPDPSFGTHFFQNLTSFRVGYFTINPSAKNGFIDFDWLCRQPVVDRTDFVAHLRLEKPLDILIDGRVGKGIIAG
ncbi:MAG: PEP/pyruvate-binding domain-containing protein [Candidatus Zixiibacteriota bacterium]